MQDQYRRLFSFAKDEDSSLAQYMEDPEPGRNFHLPMSLQARDELQLLNGKLNDLTLNPMKPDDWILCRGDTNFKPSKYYRFMFGNLTPPPTHITAIMANVHG